MLYSVFYACVSHIGNVRGLNQDNFICDGHFMEPDGQSIPFPLTGVSASKPPSLFGVFDGMGGEEQGEVAAGIAAKSAAGVTLGGDVASDLLEFCQRANRSICDYARANDLFAMGTTAALLAFAKDGITLCNIGDSKIFRYSGGRLEQISRDHVDIAPFGNKPPLLQNLGIPPDEMVIEPYVARGAYRDGDRYLICSDGLTDMVAAEEIAQVLASHTTEAGAVGELLQRALSNGGRDNISIILCRVRRRPGWFGRWRGSRDTERKKDGYG